MRKGNIQFILSIVIAIVSLIALLIIIGKMKIFFDKTLSEADCAGEVLASSQITKLSKGKVAADITCPTKNEPVTALDEKEALGRVAKDMKECWDAWGRGRLLLFDKDAMYCHICSYLQFEGSGELPDLQQFLVETSIPGRQETYMQYLVPEFSGELYKGVVEGQYQQNALNIDRSKKYAVIFYYPRGEKQVNLFLTKINEDLGKKSLAAGGAFVVGAVATNAVVAGLVCASTAPLCVGITVVGSAAVGIAAATGASYLFDDPPQYASAIVVRELSEDNIEDLGCAYSFAGRD